MDKTKKELEQEQQQEQEQTAEAVKIITDENNTTDETDTTTDHTANIEDTRDFKKTVKERNDSGAEAKETLEPIEEETAEDEKKSNLFLYIGIGLIGLAVAYYFLNDKTEKVQATQPQRNHTETAPQGTKSIFTN